MSGNNLMLFYCLVRFLSTISAIGGAVFLAYHGKDGWGWMVFLAIVLGMYSLTTD